MNKILRAVIVVLVLCAANTWAMGIQGSLSGSWFNEDQSGHGLSVEIISPDRAVAYWYVFDPQGHPLWLVIDGPIEGNTIHGQAYYVDGMVWGEFDPATKTMHDWGTVDIEFVDCDNAMVTWNSMLPQYGAGQLSMVRLTSIFRTSCLEGISPTTGYWEVSWNDLTTGTTEIGTAIIDDSGLVTVDFGVDDELRHLGGMLSQSAPGEPWVLDGRLTYGLSSESRELSMVGMPTTDGFRFTCDTDDIVLSYLPDRPNVTVTQAYLDGEWSWATTSSSVLVTNGGFSYTIRIMGVEFSNTVQLAIPYYGGNTIPLEASRIGFGVEGSYPGHAFYWRDDAAGMEYMEIRWTDPGYGLLHVGILERPIPQ